MTIFLLDGVTLRILKVMWDLFRNLPVLILAEKTISIVCFEIAPEYRGMGLASAFIDRICADAKLKGYVAVEGYSKIYEGRNDFDFYGPVRLYQKSGFQEVARKGGQIIMRKVL